MRNLFKMKKLLYSLSMLVCLLGVTTNAWASGSGPYNTWLRTQTADASQGLVYAAKSSAANPDDNQYGALVLSSEYAHDEESRGEEDMNFEYRSYGIHKYKGGVLCNFYGWAKPARGWKFNKWTGVVYTGDADKKAAEYAASPQAHKGTADLIKAPSWGGGSGDPAAGTAEASWMSATPYIVTYEEPVGGVYTVEYKYDTIKNNSFTKVTETLNLAPNSGDKRPYGIADGSQENYSYETDVVILSTAAGNFVGWYEDGVEKSTDNPYTYPITKNANITALFKWIEPVAAEEKRIRTTDNSADVNESVIFSMDNRISDWATADFTVTLVDPTGSGTFALGSCSYNSTSDELTVNFTYNANGHYEEGSSVTIQVAPANASYGTSASVFVRAIAQENSANQARVSGDGFATREGNLTDMLAIANEHTDATVTLLQSISVSSPLVVTKSMTLDLNNWVLSSTAANKIISVEGTDTKLTISDNSYLKGGEIQLICSANAAIAAIEVTGANRLLYNHGKMSVVNNAIFASNANAKACGIDVSGAGNVVMQGGSIHVESDHDAHGVSVSESGNATLNVGKIEVEAKANAYAIYSAGKINVAEGVSLAATANSSNEAAALYLTAGTAVVDNVTMTATSAGTNAYGAKVSGGKLTLNGVSIASTAVTSHAYGVYIAANGNVTIQQQANITAEVTGASGTRAYGIQNLGTLILKNSIVLATSKTYPTAVNSETSAISTTIEGGTYTAVAPGDHAYGLHHQYGALNVDGGTFSATAAGDNVYGARAGVDGIIANATISGETTGNGKTAYGFVGGVANKNITLTNCMIKAKSATSNAYAIFSRANVTATGCTLEAKTLSGATAHGFYAENGTNALTNTSATVEAYTTSAYGINYLNGLLTVSGGSYNVTARQATAIKAGDSEAYGIKVADGKTATLSNATFNVRGANNSFSQKVYGAYTGTGTINSTGCTYTVDAAKQVYGVRGEKSSSVINLLNDIISSTSITTNAYGVYSNGTFTINAESVKSEAATYPSYALYFNTNANGNVLGGKFKTIGTSTNEKEIVAPVNTESSADNVQIKGGFFNIITQLRYYVPTGYDIYGVDNSAPEYAQGYYYTVNDHLPYENVCHITEANRGFPTLAEAFDYVRDHQGTFNIIMTQPYTLPAGSYTLPSNATLVVPENASRTQAQGKIAKRRAPNKEQIVENRCLILDEGANLDVYGKIEVSADQYTINVSRISYVQGPYGRIHLRGGSTITLNNGADIYAWGYITGDGEIRVKNGATVYEDFQVHDMPSTSDVASYWTTSPNKGTYSVFLMNNYYIQNVEAPTKYYYGGKLTGSISITDRGTATTPISKNDIKLVGVDGAFFNVTTNDESAWVCKRYDAATDRVCWETNSSAELGSIQIDLSGASIDSRDYKLPITHNMTIHALSGNLVMTQNTVLLPGSEVIIDKTATLQVNAKDPLNKDMGLYLYDKSQWSKDASPIVYSPSWPNGVCPRTTTASSMKDAAIYVKGKIEVEGALYTTEGGAAIYSDDINAGTIKFGTAAAEDGTIYKKHDGAGATTVTSAKLRNGGETGPDANMTVTKGVATAGDTYAYTNIDGTGFKWTRLKTIDDCTIADVTDPEHPIYYAKPQGYVAITSKEEDANHLFYSVEGEGDAKRKFINMPMESGCQWWEVTATSTPGVYYCATNDTYYKYDTESEAWVEYKVNVTFYFTDPKNDAADKKKVLEVNYGAKPDASIVSNPTKAADAAATYQFFGWKSSKTEKEYAYTAELESVTEDMYYLPVFTPTAKKYTITFNDAKNGANVPVEVAYGSHPSYEPKKDPTAQYTYYFLNWTDASSNTYVLDDELPAVTGAATYTAHWAQVVNKYTITWKNGEEVLQTDSKQPFGTPTVFTGTLPTKPMDDNFVYEFSGWRSTLTGQTYANGSTPNVAGETTYEAQFSTTPRYAITFANYDGTQLQKEAVTAGEHPVYNGLTPGRTRDFDGYYRFTGWKNTNGDFYDANATLPGVTAKETYTAQYKYVTELYLITLNNVNGNGASWAGKFGVDATPFYDQNNDDVADMPTKAGNAKYSYPFTGWTPELQPVSGEATYTAQFGEEINSYTITFANLDGNGASQEVVVEYGQTPVCPVADSDIKKVADHTTYAFIGWNTAIVPVSGVATYTAQFSSTGTVETFPITFDLDNGSEPVVRNVAYNTLPVIENPTKDPDEAFTYMFNRWEPAIVKAAEPATYTAQYTQTLNKYTVRFVNYDGTELQSSDLAYGTTPSYSGTPKKPLDEANAKAYTFSGWSPAIGSVTGNVTYTAQFNEIALAATVTTAEGDVNGYASWSDAYSNRANNCTIKLYKDVTGLTTMQALDKIGMTLDLNGHTMSGTFAANRGIVSSTATNVTITDSSVGKTGTISSSASVNGSPYVLYVNGGSLTIDYANVSAQNTRTRSTSNAYGVYVNSGTVVINDGKFKATSGYSSGTKSAVYIRNNYGTATIKGGYYSNSVTPATGYQCVTTSELSGYTHKVIPVVYTITLNKGTRGSANGSATVDFAAAALKTFTPVTAAGYDCTGYFDEELQVLNADGTFAAENVSGYIADGKWSKADNCTLTAIWSLSTTLEANNNDNIPVSETATVDNIIIHEGGSVTIEESVTITTTNLILEASESASGQIIENGAISATNVYYDLKLNTDARHWHAFGVPWAVDINTDKLVEVDNDGNVVRTLHISRDYEIMYYDGAERATNGPSAACWKYLRHYEDTEHGQPVDELVPGHGYMIAFGSHVNTVRFTKKSGAPIIFDGSVELTVSQIGAVSNPMAYHVTMSNMGATVGQVHDGGEIGHDGYEVVDITDKRYVVGKTVYIQPAASGTVVVAVADGGVSPIAAAPVRRGAANKRYLTLGDYYMVELTPEDGSRSAKVYVLPEEDKEDKYVAGHDLAKMGMSDRKAQLWVERYDAQLGLNTTAPMDGVAEFPVSVYAPKAGEYTVSLVSEPDDEYTVYLTLNGEAIWNLSSSEYAVELAAGTNKSYGLRLVANKTPQTATGIDEAVVDAQGEIKKVIINDKVFIIRGENVYSVDGQLVK